MARMIRLGVVAGLALAASPAGATSVKSDEKAAGGDVWYDEFYAAPSSPGAPAPAPAPAVAATSNTTRASATAGQPPHKRARSGERAAARGDHRRLARNR